MPTPLRSCILRLASCAILINLLIYINLHAKAQSAKLQIVYVYTIKYLMIKIENKNTHSHCVLIVTVCLLEGCLKVAIGQYTMRVGIFVSNF